MNVAFLAASVEEIGYGKTAQVIAEAYEQGRCGLSVARATLFELGKLASLDNVTSRTLSECQKVVGLKSRLV